jgi:phage baseplate assembly protein W
LSSGFAPSLPLNIGEKGDYEQITTYKSLIKQNFKNLLLTVPGERIMNSDLGIGIQTFLFEQNDTFTYDQVESAISSQIERYMPYITLEGIDIVSIEDGDGFSVTITYQIVPLQQTDQLEIGV